MIVEFEHRTRMPTRIGNYVVRVDNDGALFAHLNAREPALDSEWTTDPKSTRHGAVAQPRATIDRVLRKHGFFELAPHYEAPATQGGVIRRLTYWDPQGAARSVTVDRANNPQLDRIIRKLLEALDLEGFPAP